MAKNESRGLWDWALVKTIVLVSIVFFIAIFLWGGFTEESNRQAIRLSARISAILFCLAFAASAFHQLTQNSFSFWIFRNRKFFGISFAIIHLIHLGFLVLLQAEFHSVFIIAKTSSLIGGGLAYLFLVLMLLTSFPRFAKYLSRTNWKRLHTVGGYWIWFIFFKSYWKRAFPEAEYIPLVILFLIVLALRLWQLWEKRKTTRAPVST